MDMLFFVSVFYEESPYCRIIWLHNFFSWFCIFIVLPVFCIPDHAIVGHKTQILLPFTLRKKLPAENGMLNKDGRKLKRIENWNVRKFSRK